MKAIYVMGEDIVAGADDPEAVREALRAAELVIVQDIFPNQTSELAHFVLPGSTFAEKSGHTFNFEGRLCAVRRAAPNVEASREDWEIPARLAAALGADFGHRSSSELWAEIEAVALPVQTPGTSEPAAIDAAAAPTSDEFPMALVTETNLFTAGAAARRGAVLAGLYAAAVEVNPADAKRLQLEDGAQVEVRSSAASFKVPVRLSRAVPEGVVYVADGLPEAPARDLNRGRPDATPVSIVKAGGRR